MKAVQMFILSHVVWNHHQNLLPHKCLYKAMLFETIMKIFFLAITQDTCAHRFCQFLYHQGWKAFHYQGDYRKEKKNINNKNYIILCILKNMIFFWKAQCFRIPTPFPCSKQIPLNNRLFLVVYRYCTKFHLYCMHSFWSAEVLMRWKVRRST